MNICKLTRKNMKKVTKASIIIAVLLFLGSLMYSCKPSQQCPSYGEVKKYQKEIRR